jgi:hypothetical protein
MHTTLGAPGSTGLVKVVNGIIQAPATLLVNADVSDTAAILVSKISGAAPLASPTFTGTVTIPAGASIDGFAPLASPTFTGTPLSTTAAVDTNTTQIATTAYVVGQGYAKLASPTFSGTPSLPTGTIGVTQSASDNSTKLATTAFVTTAVATAAGTPYDLPAEIPGTPDISTKVVNFKAVRAFVLSATGHQGGQLTAPSGNFICTVRKNATTLGTITFGVSSFSSSITGTLLERTFAATDVLSVETPAADLGIDTPFFTLFMTLA